MRRIPWMFLATLMMAVILLSGRAVRADGPSIDEPDTIAAKKHFAAGAALYDTAKFRAAIVEFEAANKIKPLPEIDFAIGRAHDRLEQWAEAARAYARYVAARPNAPDAEELRRRVLLLRQRAAPPRPELAMPPATTTASVPPTSVDVHTTETLGAPAPVTPRRRVATWVVGAAGLVLLGGSAITGGIAHAKYTELQSQCGPDLVCPSSKASDAQGIIATGQPLGVACDVLLGVGLGAIATSLVLFAVEGRHPIERQAWRVTPTIGRSAAGLSFELAL